MADKSHLQIDKKLARIEARLSAVYARAEAEIEQTAKEYFEKFEKLDEQKKKLVESGKLTEDEYITWRKNKILYGKRFTEMKEQCARQILEVNKTAIAYVNGELPEVYSLGYNALAPDVDGVGGYTFTLLDADTVKNLATADKSLLPKKKLAVAKDIAWNMKNINAEALQGILQGESMEKIAKRMRKVEDMNLSAAIRTARTLVTGAENKGRHDSYVKAEKDGIILKNEWIATFDMRTRDAHAELDGQIRGVNEPFENSIGKIMYPGDPNADPSNVYNCRCTTAAKVLGFRNKKEGFGASGKTSSIGKAEQIGTVDYSNSNQVLKTLFDAEKESANLHYEVNCTVTSDGKIWKAVGDSNFVDLSSITSDLKGSFSYHNHPTKETRYSFSAQDAAFFIDSKMQYAKASDNLFEYTMKRTPQTIDSDYDSVYNIFVNIIKTDVRKLEWDGLIDPDIDEYHETMKRVSEKYNFEYERRKLNDNK